MKNFYFKSLKHPGKLCRFEDYGEEQSRMYFQGHSHAIFVSPKQAHESIEKGEWIVLPQEEIIDHTIKKLNLPPFPFKVERKDFETWDLFIDYAYVGAAGVWFVGREVNKRTETALQVSFSEKDLVEYIQREKEKITKLSGWQKYLHKITVVLNKLRWGTTDE